MESGNIEQGYREYGYKEQGYVKHGYEEDRHWRYGDIESRWNRDV